jgi:heme-binding NEAT domain protein
MKKQMMILLSALLVLFAIIPTSQAQAATETTPVTGGEYDITFEVLKDKSDEISATGQYMNSSAKVIVENGKTYAVVTLKNSAWWQSLKTQAVQPGSFDDTNFIEAEVISKNEAEDTRLVKFEVQDLTKVVNAKIHIIATGVPGVGTYDNSYDIRLKFGSSDIPVTTETPQPIETPVSSDTIKDGDYTIAFKSLHETEDKESSMGRYMVAPASLTVKDGNKLVSVTLTNNEQITAFQIDKEGSFIDATVISTDKDANTRVVAFEVADLSALLNAKVQVYVAAQNYTGNHVIRLSFDQESIKSLSIPVENNNIFEDIQASWAKKYIESLAARDIIKGVTENRFAPDDNITRAQFTVLLSRALELPKQAYEGIFSDVTEDVTWAVSDIEAANRAAIVFGSNGKFNMNEQITREQMVAMVIRAIEYKDAALLEGADLAVSFADEASIHDYAKEYVGLAVGLGIINGVEVNGEKRFAPTENATRAQAATVLYNLLETL